VFREYWMSKLGKRHTWWSGMTFWNWTDWSGISVLPSISFGNLGNTPYLNVFHISYLWNRDNKSLPHRLSWRWKEPAYTKLLEENLGKCVRQIYLLSIHSFIDGTVVWTQGFTFALLLESHLQPFLVLVTFETGSCFFVQASLYHGPPYLIPPSS
jgi:hypothetical protein